MKYNFKSLNFFLITITALISITAYSQNVEDRPNIILVMTDDQGWFDVGYNGNKVVKTPFLDEMAAQGIILDRLYSASAVCSPTRASVLTGRTPFRLEIPYANQGHLKEKEITLPEILKNKAQYTTGHFGKWHLGTLTKTVKDGNRGGTIKGEQEYSIPTMHGYDTYLSTESKVPTYDPMVYPAVFEDDENMIDGWRAVTKNEATKNYGTAYWVNENEVVKDNIEGSDSRVIMDRVIPFIENAVSKKTPFFTTIWFHTPHRPLVADDEQRNQYKNLSLKEQLYYGSISAMDTQMGRLWQTINKLDIDENTIIWFCSDNGPIHLENSAGEFRGGKRDLFEGGVRVPAFVFWKGHFKTPKRQYSPMITSDYLPTILDILNIEYPDNNRVLDGESMLNILDGKENVRKEPIGFLIKEKMSWVNSQYKLYSPDNGKTYELYDLLNDKSEKNNIINEKPLVASKMKQELSAWRASVGKSINTGN
ncbi:sulfatase [Joostella sp.]|uniref:sulfatase family protein n=1 Tax=Joostella sp. TaxID=2231138 RepID=UPI003A9376E4